MAWGIICANILTRILIFIVTNTENVFFFWMDFVLIRTIFMNKWEILSSKSHSMKKKINFIAELHWTRVLNLIKKMFFIKLLSLSLLNTELPSVCVYNCNLSLSLSRSLIDYHYIAQLQLGCELTKALFLFFFFSISLSLSHFVIWRE